MEKNELIEELLSELSYRSNEGYPMLDNREQISILAEILDEWGYTEIKNELIQNLLEADGETFTATKKDTGETSVFKTKDSRDAAIEKGTHTKKEDSEEDDSKEKKKDMFSSDTGYEAPDLEKNKGNTKSRVLPKPIDSTEIGRVVSETGDTDVKNTMLDVGYGGYEKKTGSKPAPGGPGSAFNEIVSGELVLILEKYPDMTEDELADYSHKRFGNTKLGKEQKDTSGLVKNPDIEKRREEAKGTGTHTKPEFPEQHKQVMKERAAYSKSRVAAASAIKKHKATQKRIKNLQSNQP